MVQYACMKQTRGPLVIGNWKMNPSTIVENQALARAVAKIAKSHPAVTVAVAPAAPFLWTVKRTSSTLMITAQTMHDQSVGAFTGEVSPTMLKDIGVVSVIIGHSERRALGETNEQITRKVFSALKHSLQPIVCVGETERDAHGDFFAVVKEQIMAAIAAVPPSRYKDIVIAYEPIWAIGTGQTATPDDVIEMQLFITKVLTEQLGRTAAAKIRIIYGGSVNEKNVEALYATGHIHGFLVGGASLRAEAFNCIIQTVARLYKGA
jgi:triosephosphate isomerase (TIM)